MNCLEFKAELDAAVEEQRSPQGDDFAAHRRDCPDCRREWNEHNILADAIALWNAATPETDLTDAIVARWLVETTGPVEFKSSVDAEPVNTSPPVVLSPETPAFAPQQNATNRGRRVMWIPAGVLALFFLLIGQGGRDDERRMTTLAPPANVDGASSSVKSVAELDALIDDVESGYWQLAQSAVTSVSGAADLFPMRNLNSTGTAPTWLPSMPRSPFAEATAPKAGDADDDGPLTQGFSKALDLLLEVVPATELPTS